MRATVGHFEIPARDPERAARFYREVFDWTVEPLAWAGPVYFRVKAAIPKNGTAWDGIDGGLTEGGTGSFVGDQPLLMIHIEGSTLEECLERITEAGGAVDLPITPIGTPETLGRFARFLDPEGNRLGLWEASLSADQDF